MNSRNWVKSHGDYECKWFEEQKRNGIRRQEEEAGKKGQDLDSEDTDLRSGKVTSATAF